MEVRVLIGPDASACRLLRLEGLRQYPTAFASSYDEECDIGVGAVAERLQSTENGAVFGAFEEGSLIGMVGIRRENGLKLRHKALIWGMYVTPAFWRRGVGAELLKSVLDYAATNMPGLRQVNLCVNAVNTSAIEMYRGAGFEPFGVEQAFLIVDDAAQDLIHMVRVIARA
jgi:RimJ/RimL family protein N-acetyltransferase